MDQIKKNIIIDEAIANFKIEKSIKGSLAYQMDQDLQSGLSVDDVVEKAKSGVYTDTWQNRKKGVVGQKYGSEKKEYLNSSQETTVSKLKEKHNSEYVVEHLGSGTHKVSFKDGNHYIVDRDGKTEEPRTRTSHLYPKHSSADLVYSSKQGALDARQPKTFVIGYQGKYIVTNGVRAGEYMKNGAFWVRPNGEEVSAKDYAASKDKKYDSQ